MSSRWHVRLAEAAERDFTGILRWTVENFGKAQARAYARTLRSALADLAQGPALCRISCEPHSDYHRRIEIAP